MVRERLRLAVAARAALRTRRSTPGSALRHPASSRTTLTVVRLGFAVARVIGLDDAGHQVVAHDVLGRQPDEANALDILERVDRIGQARALATRQVGLAGI